MKKKKNITEETIKMIGNFNDKFEMTTLLVGEQAKKEKPDQIRLVVLMDNLFDRMQITQYFKTSFQYYD